MSKKIMFLILLVLLFTPRFNVKAETPAPAFRIMTASDSGDYIGQHASWDFSNANNSYITVSQATDSVVSFRANNFSVSYMSFGFASETGKKLSPGLYTPAKRLPFRDFYNGIDISGDGRGCNTILGAFYVHEYVMSTSTLERAAIDFVQVCEPRSTDINTAGPKLVGSLRYNSSVPDSCNSSGCAAAESNLGITSIVSKPDLVITDLQYYAPSVTNPVVGDYVGYKATIKNIGNAPAQGGFKVIGYLNGQQLRWEQYSSTFVIQPGASTIDQQYAYTKFTTAGINTIMVEVDANNVINESKEDNNTLSTLVTVNEKNQPTLTVSAATEQPAATIVPQGAQRVSFTKVKFTASSAGDVVVSSIKVERTGLAHDAVFSGVLLLDENGNKVGSVKTLDSTHLAFLDGLFTVPDLSIKIVSIAGNMALDLSQYSGEVPFLSVTGVGANAVSTINAVFPITGAGHTTNSTVKIGSLTMQKTGSQEMKLTNSSVEGVTLDRIYFTNSNVGFVTVNSGAAYACSQFQSGYVCNFSASKPTIAKNDSMTLTLNSNAQGFVMPSPSDVFAQGMIYGYGVPATEITSVQPTLTVLSPNGGETLVKGSVYIIRWKNPDGYHVLNIDLLKDDLVVSGILGNSVSSDLPPPTSYAWTVNPKSFTGSPLPSGTNYKIKVRTADGLVFDSSDAPFSIMDIEIPEPFISSLSPSSGATGTEVIIYGNNFASANTISFVGSTNVGSPVDGEQAFSASSSDGKTLKFIVPSIFHLSGEGGEKNVEVIPGKYYVVVSNAHGKSGLAYFTVALAAPVQPSILPDLKIIDAILMPNTVNTSVKDVVVYFNRIDSRYFKQYKIKLYDKLSGYTDYKTVISSAQGNADFSLLAGTYNLVFTIDSDNIIVESNESNNTFEKNITVTINTDSKTYRGDGTYDLKTGDSVIIDNAIKLVFEYARNNYGASGTDNYEFSEIRFVLYNPNGVFVSMTPWLRISSGVKEFGVFQSTNKTKKDGVSIWWKGSSIAGPTGVIKGIIIKSVEIKGDIDSPITCPALSPTAPGWCANGKIVDGGRDENGCQQPPKCLDSTKGIAHDDDNQDSSLRDQIAKLKQRVAELEKLVVETERRFLTKIDDKLTERLKGRILLQVEGKGEAWYVDPSSEKKFYMPNGDSAYEMLRKFGLGVTNKDLEKIPVGVEDRAESQFADSDDDGLSDKLEESLGTDSNNVDSDSDGHPDGEEVKSGNNPLGLGKLTVNGGLAKRLYGKILLQVEDKGQAWYVLDGKRYYMKDGSAAYQIMRFLSLGVNNSDIRKIDVGEVGQ